MKKTLAILSILALTGTTSAFAADDMMQKDSDGMMKKDDSMEKDSDGMMKKDGMMQKDSDGMMKKRRNDEKR